MFNQLKKQLFSGQSDASNHSGNFLIIFQDSRFDTRISEIKIKIKVVLLRRPCNFVSCGVSTSSIQNKLKIIVSKEHS